ncbi:MAG: squalene/phytoene synthase family protein [Rhodospirillaceae bacterium]|nr:squalene/phytoene synthase family protein [Rhodospirillaceae bacterium]
MTSSLEHCADEVRRADYDRYLTTLFAPAAARPGLFALYAFNQEIAKVRDTVTEPVLGQIRLQWWREAITEIYVGKVRAHPVVEALAAALATGPRPDEADFARLIEGREFDLAGRAPGTMAELEAYCTETSSALLWTAARLLGIEDGETRAALVPLGIAWALIGLARAIPFHARARRRFVPDDVAEAAGLSEEALFEGKADEAVGRAASALVEAAHGHLSAMRDRAGRVAPPARSLLLLAPLAGAYAKRLSRYGPAASGISPVSKVLRLWWASRRLV